MNDDQFEWDEAKRLKTIAERDIDFLDAVAVFDNRPVLHILTQHKTEKRFLSTALIKGKLFTVIWTWRGEKRRIISFRRARDGEERAYRKLYG